MDLHLFRTIFVLFIYAPYLTILIYNYFIPLSYLSDFIISLLFTLLLIIFILFLPGFYYSSYSNILTIFIQIDFTSTLFASLRISLRSREQERTPTDYSK